MQNLQFGPLVVGIVTMLAGLLLILFRESVSKDARRRQARLGRLGNLASAGATARGYAVFGGAVILFGAFIIAATVVALFR